MRRLFDKILLVIQFCIWILILYKLKTFLIFLVLTSFIFTNFYIYLNFIWFYKLKLSKVLQPFKPFNGPEIPSLVLNILVILPSYLMFKSAYFCLKSFIEGGSGELPNVFELLKLIGKNWFLTLITGFNKYLRNLIGLFYTTLRNTSKSDEFLSNFYYRLLYYFNSHLILIIRLQIIIVRGGAIYFNPNKYIGAITFASRGRSRSIERFSSQELHHSGDTLKSQHTSISPEAAIIAIVREKADASDTKHGGVRSLSWDGTRQYRHDSLGVKLPINDKFIGGILTTSPHKGVSSLEIGSSIKGIPQYLVPAIIEESAFGPALFKLEPLLYYIAPQLIFLSWEKANYITIADSGGRGEILPVKEVFENNRGLKAIIGENNKCYILSSAGAYVPANSRDVSLFLEAYGLSVGVTVGELWTRVLGAK